MNSEQENKVLLNILKFIEIDLLGKSMFNHYNCDLAFKSLSNSNLLIYLSKLEKNVLNKSWLELKGSSLQIYMLEKSNGFSLNPFKSNPSTDLSKKIIELSQQYDKLRTNQNNTILKKNIIEKHARFISSLYNILDDNNLL